MLQRERCALRPLSPPDRDLLYRWRNSDRIRAVMFHKRPIPRADHDAWFDRTLADRQSCYLIFEIDRRPVGLVNFPRIDPSARICSWGFYLGETAVAPGAGRAMGYLGLTHAFGPLSLAQVVGETLPTNERGIRFHERLGFFRDAELRTRRGDDGSLEEVVHFHIDRARWNVVRENVEMSIFGKAVRT